MSTNVLPPSAPAPLAVATASDAIEVYYTICPVFAASHIAVEFGWLAAEFEKAGANLKYLRSLSEGRGWLPHFSHKFEGHLFRDGGNIPAIWAHADNRRTRLLGLTWSPLAGRIVVRADSGLHRVADLRGRRIGLPKSLDEAKVDFARATAERGFDSAFVLHGLNPADVEIVDVPAKDLHASGQGSKPSELWTQHHRADPSAVFGNEVAALREGRVDAIYSHALRVSALERTGEFTVIEDLSRQPDWTLRLANSPWAITVNEDLVERRPEIPVAYLRAVIRAGRWINAHRDAAASIFHAVSPHLSLTEVVDAVSSIPDFVPDLSPRNLAAITLQKQFLLSRGYVKRDFDVRQWAAHELLAEAHGS